MEEVFEPSEEPTGTRSTGEEAAQPSSTPPDAGAEPPPSVLSDSPTDSPTEPVGVGGQGAAPPYAPGWYQVPPGYAPPPGFAPPGWFPAPPGYGPLPGYVPPVAATGAGTPDLASAHPGPGRGGGWFGKFLRSLTVAWITAGVLALAVLGVSVAWVTSSSPPSPAVGRVVQPQFGGPYRAGPFGGNAGSVAVAGTVASVGSKSFTVNALSGQTVIVDEQSSTQYYVGRSSGSANSVVQGANVAVQGSRSGNTVTATRVEILPSGSLGFGPTS